VVGPPSAGAAVTGTGSGPRAAHRRIATIRPAQLASFGTGLFVDDGNRGSCGSVGPDCGSVDLVFRGGTPRAQGGGVKGSDRLSTEAAVGGSVGYGVISLAMSASLWPRHRRLGHVSGAFVPVLSDYLDVDVAKVALAWPKSPAQTRPLRPL